MSAKIAQALHQVMSKVGYIQKTGNNKFHGYKYAGEADLLEKLRPAMLEAGLLLIPSVETVSAIDEHGITTIHMEYTLVHKDGDIWPHKIGAAGAGGDKNKNGVGDKGLYKAITGANKYLLFKLFQIETGDDPENDRQQDNAPQKRENPHVTRPDDVSDAKPRYDGANRIDWIDTSEHRVERLSKAKARPVADVLNKAMRMNTDAQQLVDWGVEHSEQVASLPADWEEIFQSRYQEFLDELRANKKEAA